MQTQSCQLYQQCCFALAVRLAGHKIHLLQGAPRRPYVGYPPPAMYMGYGLDMGPYRGRGRGPMPMHPAAAAAAAGRYPQAPYGYWPQYGYQFPPPFPPFPSRMPINGGRTGGRGFVGERRPPPGTPGVSSGLQVSRLNGLLSAYFKLFLSSI